LKFSQPLLIVEQSVSFAEAISQNNL
jgi:hypothetical protein